MNFKSIEALDPVIKVINEAAETVADKNRTTEDSPISEVLYGAAGVGIGGVASFAALWALGTTGLSAAGITSGLAVAGSIVGGGMVAGVLALAAPVAILGMVGVGIAAEKKKEQLLNKKNSLYNAAVEKQNAIIRALAEERDADKERIDHLNALNNLLERAIKDLKEDLGMAV